MEKLLDKKLGGIKLKNWIKKIAAPFRLYWRYFFDGKKFRTGSFEFNKRFMSDENLRAKITFEYHAIEKGLTYRNLRYLFGRARIDELVRLLQLWKDRNNSTSDKRYQAGISVLERYITVHEDNNINVDYLKLKISGLDVVKAVQGGEKTLNKKEVLDDKQADFYKFSHSRHSVRDFGDLKISIQDIKKAVDLAMTAPSACNRQSAKVYITDNENLIGQVLESQGGITGMANNISALILITADNQYFGYFDERNQTFIDGGIFTMNLLYSLTYYGIATCTLNADLSIENEILIKQLMKVGSASEDLIAFIAVGDYPEEFKIPISTRDTAEDILKVVNI